MTACFFPISINFYHIFAWASAEIEIGTKVTYGCRLFDFFLIFIFCLAAVIDLDLLLDLLPVEKF